MPVKTPALLWNTAEEILACVCLALDTDGTCPCPCRKCVVIGPPVWDTCCPDGQLTVHLDRLYVHGNFPAADNGPIFCSSPLAAEFVITLIRCVPTVKDDGTPPTCDKLSESALGFLTDLYVVERALICCLAAAKRKRKFLMRDSRTLSPEGGCAGFELRVLIEIEDTLSD